MSKHVPLYLRLPDYIVCCHFLLDLVKLLTYKGADFTLTSVHGKNALDFAKAFDGQKVVEYLDE